MKITDFCIIFTVFAICFFACMDTRQQVTYEILHQNNRYNVIMDNAVEDALRAAYENIDTKGNPQVNLKTAVSFLTDELSVMLNGKTYMSEYYKDRLVCMAYIDKEGFYYTDVDEGSIWSEKQKFSNGESTEHSDKVNEIEAFIYEKYNVLLTIPTNDGESHENTIDDYTLMTIYKDYNGMYCFSAAAIKRKNTMEPQKQINKKMQALPVSAGLVKAG